MKDKSTFWSSDYVRVVGMYALMAAEADPPVCSQCPGKSIAVS